MGKHLNEVSPSADILIAALAPVAIQPSSFIAVDRTLSPEKLSEAMTFSSPTNRKGKQQQNAPH
jgi:hypothetical protein